MKTLVSIGVHRGSLVKYSYSCDEKSKFDVSVYGSIKEVATAVPFKNQPDKIEGCKSIYATEFYEQGSTHYLTTKIQSMNPSEGYLYISFREGDADCIKTPEGLPIHCMSCLYSNIPLTPLFHSQKCAWVET